MTGFTGSAGTILICLLSSLPPLLLLPPPLHFWNKTEEKKSQNWPEIVYYYYCMLLSLTCMVNGLINSCRHPVNYVSMYKDYIHWLRGDGVRHRKWRLWLRNRCRHLLSRAALLWLRGGRGDGCWWLCPVTFVTIHVFTLETRQEGEKSQDWNKTYSFTGLLFRNCDSKHKSNNI